MKSPRCVTCIFFEKNQKQCRFYPPRYDLDFPVMDSASWCGRHPDRWHEYKKRIRVAMLPRVRRRNPRREKD